MENHRIGYTGEPKSRISRPDIHNPDALKEWVDEFVGRKHFLGFEDLLNPDGTPFTREAIIDVSKQQFQLYVSALMELKKPDLFIQDYLIHMIQRMVDPDAETVV